ncbi:PAS domain S-box protein [Halobellus sp. Atlit-31R]|nr:PAS domain S-box protein [Halobellus sp. Atlit-31R]
MYETIFRAIDDAVFVVDVERTDGDYAFTFRCNNPAHRQQTGLSEAEFEGQTPRDVLGDEQGAAVVENYRRCVEAGEPIEYEETLDLPAGTTHWQTKLTPITEDGAVTQVVGTARNVTERREREQKLRRMHRRFETVLETMSAAVFLKDTDGRYLLMNQACRDLFDIDGDADVAGLTDSELFSSDRAADYRDDDRQVVETGEPMEVEETVATAAGETVRLTRKSPVYDDDGAVEAICGVSTDITARNERERSLSQRNAFLENTSDVITLLDADGTVRYQNHCREHVPAPDAPDLVDDDPLAHIHPDDRETASQTFQSVLGEPGATARNELRTKAANGEWRWFEQRVVNKLDDPKIQGILVSSRDITERREQEQTLGELSERLRLAIDGANLGVWDWDMTTDDVEFNDHWATMLDYDPAAIDSRLDEWERRVHPDDMEVVEAALEAHIDGETEFYESEHRLRTADDEWKWIRDIGKIFERDADGNPVRAVGIHVDIDDRKRAERALREEHDMFAQGPTLLFKWDDPEAWSVEYVSENVESVVGYTAEELESGQVPFAELIHDADRERVTREVAANSDRGIDRFGHDPYRVETADGDVRWVLMHSKNVRDGSEITHRLGYLVDITERKERELELEQFREAVEQSGHMVYITDTDGRIEYVNPAFEESTGYDEADAIGRTPRILNSGEHDADYYDVFWETINAGMRWEGEIVDENAEGEQIVLDQTVSPLTDDEGEPRKFVAIAQDVTDRRAYEEALERAHDQIRRIIDLVPDLIFSKTRDGEYLLANEATAEAYGLTPEEVEGCSEEEIIPDVRDSEQFRQDDLDVIESGESREIPEEELTTADGETKVLQTTKIPYTVPGSGEDALLGYARDVTALKEYERTLERQRDDLEILNQMVRHDIRNDLQLVLAYAEMLESHVDEDGEEYVRKVLDAARDAVAITQTAREVTDVLLQSDAERTPVRLGRTLERQIDELRSNYEHALVTLDGQLPAVAVLADDMLGSVFRNLLNNAVVHNDEPIPEVVVSATATDETVRVDVADNGPGISDEQRDRIFEEGEKGLDSEGSGLGLYLVRTLVERYGGDVWVEDSEPTGSVFVVELPRVAE